MVAKIRVQSLFLRAKILIKHIFDAWPAAKAC